jgi:hypothetical protein
VAAESVIVAAAAVVLGMAIATGAIHLTDRRPTACSARVPLMSRPVSSRPIGASRRSIGAGLFAVDRGGLTTAWRASRVAPLRQLRR